MLFIGPKIDNKKGISYKYRNKKSLYTDPETFQIKRPLINSNNKEEISGTTIQIYQSEIDTGNEIAVKQRFGQGVDAGEVKIGVVLNPDKVPEQPGRGENHRQDQRGGEKHKVLFSHWNVHEGSTSSAWAYCRVVPKPQVIGR